MFFNDKTKHSVIFYKSLYPQFDECVGRCKRPLASRRDPEASGDTASMLGRVLDHQTPLARPLEPPTRPQQSHKSVNIVKNQSNH